MENTKLENEMISLTEKLNALHNGSYNMFSYDRNNDSRIFMDGDSITVYVPTMTEDEYNDMEKVIADLEITKQGYSVYGWNDSSGFDYWNREGESNYIQVTANITDPNVVNLEELYDDMWEAFNLFSDYDNSDTMIEHLNQ